VNIIFSLNNTAMVKYFHFHNTNIGSGRHLDKPLKSFQCNHMKQNGQRCMKRCLIGLRKCWIHLQSEHCVRIRDAGPLGQGLFASDGTDGNELVFRTGDSPSSPDLFPQSD
jgi:hypothetical protein